MPTTGRNDVRNLEAGMLLIGVGAILLLISLFLEWYQPRIDAWEIFEVWDLVLALLAICAIVAVASRLGLGPLRPTIMLAGPAVAALVIVVYAFLDPPPLTTGIDGDPGTGLWLALAASILMATGAALSFARVSVAITREPATVHPGTPVDDPATPLTAARPAAAPPPLPSEPAAPRASRRFLRSDPAEPPPPTEPTRRI
jgi:hypothetical protein